MFRSVGFADWFLKFKTYSKLRQNHSKNNLVRRVKVPWHKRMEVAGSGLWAPGNT